MSTDTDQIDPIDPELLEQPFPFGASLSSVGFDNELHDLDNEEVPEGAAEASGAMNIGIGAGTTGVTGSGTKRKKGAGGDGENVKRTRQSQSCDACRARKVKCDRPPPGSAAALNSSMESCTHCRSLHLPCTFDYKPKKRGPPNLYLRKLKNGDEESPTGSPLPKMERSSHIGTSDPSPYGQADPQYQSYEYNQSNLSRPPVGRAPSQMSASSYSLNTASGVDGSGRGQPTQYGRHVDDAWDEALVRTVAAHATQSHPHPHPSHPSHHRPSTVDTSPIASYPGPSLSPTVPLSGPGLSPGFTSNPYADIPHNSSNPLEQVLPRGLLYHIVDLFFDYIYPLTPCLHRPSFMRDLHSKREEKLGEEEWTHMVLSVVSSTLCQLPRAFVAMPRRDVKALVERCYIHCRNFMARDFATCSIERNVMMYFIASGLFSGGANEPVPRHLFSANAGLLISLGLHEESTYSTMPPIERELRRRIYWLLYGGDRSYASSEGTPLIFSQGDCSDVALPAELDDECITADGYASQPEDRTPILAGFNYISKLFRYIGQVITKRRADRRIPPSGVVLQMRINEVDELHDRIMTLMEDCPEVLRLGGEDDHPSVSAFSPDWGTHAFADIRELFTDPKSSKAVVKDAYLVQQANIYVTQQMARLMVIQYRDELFALRSAEIAGSRDSGPSGRRYSSTRKTEKQSTISEEEKDQVMTDLLVILQKIPIQVIAVNSRPIVSKIRFVASTLLDALQSPAPSAATSPIPGPNRKMERKQRAQTYLWDFLKILSEIEELYSMNDDERPPGS